MSAAAVGALALAMAAVGTIVTLANGIFFKPLPFDAPEQVVLLDTDVTVNGNTFTTGVSYPELLDWRAGARSLTAISGFIAGSLALGRGLETLLSEIEPSDPITLAAVPLLLAVVAAAACVTPTIRAVRVDAARTLRAE